MPRSPFTDHLIVVLVSTRNPLNIGAVARAMSNFGFSNLRLVNPYGPSFRGARSAVGATALLKNAEVFKNVADAVADCSLVVGTTSAGPRELHLPLHRLDAAAPIIRKRLRTARVALLFGSEKVGLSNRDLNDCQWLLRVPTRNEHRSMNLAQSVLVCLYELVRGNNSGNAKLVRPHENTARVTAGEIERITTLLLETLHAAGYFPPRTAAVKEEKLRRLVRKFNLSAADAETMLGMLRKMLYKMSH